ncbi:alpha/beta fold hydrolase [Actinoalloteichus spitiensis]|uniref:alpha/beta fold hydrolase n=1 Tax=Actinoalloteichus spitiensis TaxID=252394 RepID=UPI0012F706D8|nr:alpha/beta fold hydrolase [Actinoalloteichus spitiensis]
MLGARVRRPVVYVLHGLLGTAYGHFGKQIGAWRSEADVVPVDLPGHGRCRLDAEDGYLDVALRYVLALVRRFGPGRLVAASYLGGPVAVRCAALAPDLVSSLVLTGVAPGLDREAFLSLLGGFHRLAGESRALVAEYERLHGPRWRATLDAYTAHATTSYADRIQIRPETLAELHRPVLIINGSLRSVEREAARTAGDIGPEVRGRVVEGGGHLPGNDDAATVNRVVSGFWREVERGPAPPDERPMGPASSGAERQEDGPGPTPAGRDTDADAVLPSGGAPGGRATSGPTPTSPPNTVAALRAALVDAVNESDPTRRLDSLETVVVLAYLRNTRLVSTPPEPPDRPDTIEGWVTWVARRSLVS